MTSSNVAEGCLAPFFMAVAFVCGIILGGKFMHEDWLQETVDRGHAEWTVDQSTGKTEWCWVEDRHQERNVEERSQ
ncbi:MAG: hypothetical protein AAGJ40_09550 [Planctomycetota bacterium]